MSHHSSQVLWRHEQGMNSPLLVDASLLVPPPPPPPQNSTICLTPLKYNPRRLENLTRGSRVDRLFMNHMFVRTMCLLRTAIYRFPSEGLDMALVVGTTCCIDLKHWIKRGRSPRIQGVHIIGSRRAEDPLCKGRRESRYRSKKPVLVAATCISIMSLNKRV